MILLAMEYLLELCMICAKKLFHRVFYDFYERVFNGFLVSLFLSMYHHISFERGERVIPLDS